MPIPILTYEAPRIITVGGIYENLNIRSTTTDPALRVQTYDPVTFINCVFVSRGEAIVFCQEGSKNTFIRNSFYADTPVYANEQMGRAIDSYKMSSFIFENNYLEGTGGVLINRWGDNEQDAPIKVRYNRVKNILNTKGDGTRGAHRQFLQFNTIPLHRNIEVSWNEVINLPGQSWVEDIININATGGTPDSPMLVHDNYLYGAFPIPATDSGFSGSGITVDGSAEFSGTFETTPAYIHAYNNQVIACGNAAMNIAIGHHVRYYNNRMIASALMPDGVTRIPNVWAGCCIFNGSSLSYPVFGDNEIVDNVIGYYREGINYKFTNRQDEMNDRSVNFMPPDLNTYLPNPITLQTEADEFTSWNAKLAANNIIVGIDGENEETTTTSTSTSSTTSSTTTLAPTTTTTSSTTIVPTTSSTTSSTTTEATTQPVTTTSSTTTQTTTSTTTTTTTTQPITTTSTTTSTTTTYTTTRKPKKKKCTWAIKYTPIRIIRSCK